MKHVLLVVQFRYCHQSSFVSDSLGYDIAHLQESIFRIEQMVLPKSEEGLVVVGGGNSGQTAEVRLLGILPFLTERPNHSCYLKHTAAPRQREHLVTNYVLL